MVWKGVGCKGGGACTSTRRLREMISFCSVSLSSWASSCACEREREGEGVRRRKKKG